MSDYTLFECDVLQATQNSFVLALAVFMAVNRKQSKTKTSQYSRCSCNMTPQAQATFCIGPSALSMSSSSPPEWRPPEDHKLQATESSCGQGWLLGR